MPGPSARAKAAPLQALGDAAPRVPSKNQNESSHTSHQSLLTSRFGETLFLHERLC